MEAKKVLRYYSDCGKGFWKKQQAVTHDQNCKCWKNPKIKGCLSCTHYRKVKDSDGSGNTWDINLCLHSDCGVPVHKDFDYIRKYCPFWKKK